MHCINTIPFLRIAQELLTTEKWKKYEGSTIETKYSSEKEIKFAIEKAKSTVEIFSQDHCSIEISPATLIKNWCSLPLLNFLPEERRKEFCWDMMREFIKKNPLNENQKLNHEAEIVFMVLTK